MGEKQTTNYRNKTLKHRPKVQKTYTKHDSKNDRNAKKISKKMQKKHKKRRKNGKKNASKTPNKYQEIRHLVCKDPIEGAPKGIRYGIKTCPTSSTKVLRLGQTTTTKATKK